MEWAGRAHPSTQPTVERDGGEGSAHEPAQAGLRVHRREVIGPAAWPAVLDRVTHERLVAVLTAPQPRSAPAHPVHGADSVGRNRVATGSRRRTEVGLLSGPQPPRPRGRQRHHRRRGAGGADSQHAVHRRGRRPAGERVGRQRPRSLLCRTCRGSRTTSGPSPKTSAKAGSPGPKWLAARGPLEADSTPPRGHRGDRPSPVPVNLRESWPTLSVDRQRAILAAVFGAVLIHPSARRGGPAPMVEGIRRLDLDRVEVRWRA